MRRKLFIILLLLALVTGCSSNEKPVNKKIDDVNGENTNNSNVAIKEVDPHKGQSINPLTGLYISEKVATRRPIGVMINNLKKALPQSGISQADIIYETLVEGGICRLFAIYQDFNATKIGPIRSARHYYLDFAFDHDAIYAHYGRSPQADLAFSNWNSPNIDGLSYLDDIMCFVDPNRTKPHNRYTSYSGLIAAINSTGYRTDIKINNKFNFSDKDYRPKNGTKSIKVTLPFSHYQTSWFEYNDKDKLYYRFQFNDTHIDKETGEQLKYKNVIIQYANIWVIPNDSEGRLDMNLISKGNGLYVTNGVYIPITWEKTSHYNPTKYYLEDGTKLKINKGKTWISVFPLARKDKILIQ
jgi:hypothetical protein